MIVVETKTAPRTSRTLGYERVRGYSPGWKGPLSVRADKKEEPERASSSSLRSLAGWTLVRY